MINFEYTRPNEIHSEGNTKITVDYNKVIENLKQSREMIEIM